MEELIMFFWVLVVALFYLGVWSLSGGNNEWEERMVKAIKERESHNSGGSEK